MAFAFAQAKILVFAKAPIPGQVKTRLTPAYTPEQAAAIHRNLVQHTLTTVCDAALCPVELWCSPDVDAPFFQYCQRHFDIPLRQQHGNDLGERMCNAMQDTLQGMRQAILIGTDCPRLTADDLSAALTALNAPHDCTIAPARDGGYVLIGLTRCHPLLFENIEWGSAQVMTQTRARIELLNFSFAELPTLPDVDYPQDLQMLPNALAQLILEER